MFRYGIPPPTAVVGVAPGVLRGNPETAGPAQGKAGAGESWQAGAAAVDSAPSGA